MNIYRYEDRKYRANTLMQNGNNSYTEENKYESIENEIIESCKSFDFEEEEFVEVRKNITYEHQGYNIIEVPDFEEGELEVKVKDYYCIVYFEVMRDLNITFEEYLVLEAMLYRSKKNIYKAPISHLAKHLCFSRASIYQYIKGLIQKDHIKKEVNSSKVFYLTHDIKDRFESHKYKANYIKIYHYKRKELGLSPSQFGFLYLIYSLSKRNKYPFAGINYYIKHLGISERHYYTSLEKFENKKLIIRKKIRFKLDRNIYEWFNAKERNEDII